MQEYEELLILTGKASQKYKLERNIEISLFSLMNVARCNGTKVYQIEKALECWNTWEQLARFLETEIYHSLHLELGKKEPKE